MSIIEGRLLSKVIDQGDTAILKKYGIGAGDFRQDRKTFEFILEYEKEYKTAPTFSEVVAECPDFEYTPEVADNVLYMCKKLKSDNAKRKAYELLQKQATEKFSTMSGTDFTQWLADETRKIVEATTIDNETGIDFATSGAERKEMYLKSQDKKTRSFIPTPYPTLSEWLGGGYELGDYVLLQAYTNRGKSWIASQVGLTSWSEGFGVIHYSPELTKKQQLQRLDTIQGHFKNSDMRIGELKNEKQYMNYLDGFNQDQEIPYIVKTMGDLPKGLSISVIEADLKADPRLKMVIIDGFNLMSHEGRDGNRNNMSKTSRQLRQLFSKMGVVGVVVHQVPTSAEKDNTVNDEAGNRIVSAPKLHQYSETIACIQDASVVLNFDQNSGVGQIRLAKARTPNVDKELELHCDFDEGFIREASPIDYI